MKSHLLAVSHRMPEWIISACADYSKRLPDDWRVTLHELKPADRTGRNLAQIFEKECVKIDSLLNTLTRTLHHNKYLIVLDERGCRWSTQQFANQFQFFHDQGIQPIFIIGGADGLSPKIKSQAQTILQLSEMTLAHGLVRVVLIEQIYRAWSLLHAHPYHRE